MTHTEAEKLLESLAEQYGFEPFDPERDVTKDMLAERIGISPQAAYDILQKEVREGRMVKRPVRLNNLRCTAYRAP